MHRLRISLQLADRRVPVHVGIVRRHDASGGGLECLRPRRDIGRYHRPVVSCELHVRKERLDQRNIWRDLLRQRGKRELRASACLVTRGHDGVHADPIERSTEFADALHGSRQRCSRGKSLHAVPQSVRLDGDHFGDHHQLEVVLFEEG